ncbi:MAG: hypothetical protein JXA90_05845, partial [Planctomycetes bacterium]|nr:hypothetical protein [Planctomycetota bacterium]
MSDEPSPPLPFSRSTFSRRGRWLSRLNLCAAVLLSLCILVLVNFIIFRHPWRIDLTEEGLYALSDETKVKLEMVREPVVVI